MTSQCSATLNCRPQLWTRHPTFSGRLPWHCRGRRTEKTPCLPEFRAKWANLTEVTWNYQISFLPRRRNRKLKIQIELRGEKNTDLVTCGLWGLSFVLAHLIVFLTHWPSKYQSAQFSISLPRLRSPTEEKHLEWRRSEHWEVRKVCFKSTFTWWTGLDRWRKEGQCKN